MQNHKTTLFIMNIKYLFFTALFLRPFLILSQITYSHDMIAIDITKLNTGYWHAENQSDSVYLNISSSICYYSEKGSVPRKARMYAELAYVSLDKPQKVLEERTIIIEFDNLDTLPEPYRTSEIRIPDFSSTFEESEFKNKELVTTTYTPKIFAFKRLLPNKLILQERDSLKRLFVFNKLKGEKPNFRQIQINKLDTMAKKIGGLWGNEHANSFFFVKEPYISPENWLRYEPNLSCSSIVFSINTNDSIMARRDFLDITWEKDSEYILRLDLSETGKYKIDFITDKKLLLTNDSVHFKAYYSKLAIEPFPDSILRGLQSKAWCDTVFNDYEQKIDTTIFDFGERADVPDRNDIFQRPYGHYFGRYPHSDIFLDFFAFHGHYYFIKTTHGAIDLWEIVSLTPNSLIVESYQKVYFREESEKLVTKKYFLHPQNSEYFEKGRRIRY
jgi:hypothetical protein